MCRRSLSEAEEVSIGQYHVGVVQETGGCVPSSTKYDDEGWRHRFGRVVEVLRPGWFSEGGDYDDSAKDSLFTLSPCDLDTVHGSTVLSAIRSAATHRYSPGDCVSSLSLALSRSPAWRVGCLSTLVVWRTNWPRKRSHQTMRITSSFGCALDKMTDLPA